MMTENQSKKKRELTFSVRFNDAELIRGLSHFLKLNPAINRNQLVAMALKEFIKKDHVIKGVSKEND